MLTSDQLRGRFLAFFKANGHAVRPSDALIPTGDPTVLFTSAGMNQFKEYFLGKRTDLTRAASSQKCLRTGDLERVGKSASHHSFFEMLGNFSFGDYFKGEAIGWGWEFLTGTLDFAGTQKSKTPELCLSLPADKLWVSVYEEDDEAVKLWRALGVPEAKIKRFGQEDNFWPSNAPNNGPNGPCGPCSEIYYDPDGQTAGPGSLEVWNLVFTQFDRQDGGRLAPLPRKNIDTGMGLERLTRVVMQHETGKRDVTDYETDLFAPIVAAIRALPHGKKRKADQVTFAERAIADHLRAMVFLLVDGVRPSNEGRGYVLRMLIRRASRLGRTVLDIERVFLARLVSTVSTAMAQAPYHTTLVEEQGLIEKAVDQEEAQFSATLEAGTSRLEGLIDQLKGAKQRAIPGEEAFKLYDTYGFPIELTNDLAEEHGLTVDRAGFDALFKAQQERSRAGSQFGGGIFLPHAMKLPEPAPMEFIGYNALEGEARVLGIWKDGAWVKDAKDGERIGLVLSRSPFYGESGGQIGDQGSIAALHGTLTVLNTTWADDLLVHEVQVTSGRVAVQEPVKATVDRDRRLKVARSHTATHLLHWALRKVLGPEAVQAGSLVEAERLRFDFSALGALNEDQQANVERLVNERVRLADAVQTDVMKMDEARRLGATALFGEKYGDQVRVVAIGDYSRELCGGTHLAHTGSVGVFRIVSESAIAAGTRRVEALVGEAALDRQQQDAQTLRAIARQLSRPPTEALQGLEELFAKVRMFEKDMKRMKLELAGSQAQKLVAEAKRINGVPLVVAQIDGADREFLSALADAIRGRMTSGIALLVSAEQPHTVAWVLGLTSDLVKKGLHAGQILKPIAAMTQGSGGGRPDFAQAGGKDPSKVAAALARAEEVLKEAIR